MAIREEELLDVQPGDIIQIISENEAKLNGHWYGRVSGWNGSDSITGTMNDYCGKYLTVKQKTKADRFIKIFVEETNYWWKADFISCVVHEEFEPADDRAIMELIFAQ